VDNIPTSLSKIGLSDLTPENLGVVFDLIEHGILFLDPQLRVRGANKAYKKMWGIADEVIRQNPHVSEILKIVRPTNRIQFSDEEYEDYIRVRVAAIQSEESTTIDVELASGDTYRYQCMPVPDGGRLLTFYDVSSLKHAEYELRDSQHRFESIYEYGVGGIAETDTDGRIIRINPAWRELLEYEENELRGMTMIELTHPDDRKESAERYGALMSGEISRYRLEKRYVSKSGKIIWAVLGVSSIRDSSGKITFTVGEIQDITNLKAIEAELKQHRDDLQKLVTEKTKDLVSEIEERKGAEAALLESEKRLGDFAHSSSDWFWELDKNLRFIEVGEKFFEITNIDRNDVIGKTRREVAGKIQVAQEPEKWEAHFRLMETHKPFRDFNYFIYGADGKRRLINLGGIPVLDSDGNFSGYRGTGSDVTRVHEAEEGLREVNKTLESRVGERTRDLLVEKERAELASRAKSEFLANMSHELRTPLNAIIGFSQITMNETFGPHSNPIYADYAKDICEASTHLLSVISDILDVSKVEAGEIILEDEVVNVAKLIGSCVLLIQERAKSKGISPEIIIDPGVHNIRADQRILKQILINLLSNAVKFAPIDGKMAVCVEIENSGELRISVIDNGCGIAPENISQVQEPFGQVRDRPDLAQEGTGLGLPLAKRLAELHGGVLEINSKLGVGSSIHILLPADRVLARH
jgi:PAS domain S-box-containing protein